MSFFSSWCSKVWLRCYECMDLIPGCVARFLVLWARVAPQVLPWKQQLWLGELCWLPYQRPASALIHQGLSLCLLPAISKLKNAPGS